MSSRPFSSPDCAVYDPELAELALGSLSGKVRVATLAHVERCDRCSAELEELSAAADGLFDLAPLAEPPVGFEAGVMQRLRSPALGGPTSALERIRSAPHRAGRALLAVAAVVAALAAGAAMDRALTTKGPGASLAAGGAIENVRLVSAGKQVGEVQVFAGNPTWVMVDVQGVDWYGAVRCQLTLAGERPVTLGSFWLSGDRGAWGAAVAQPAGRLREAKLLNNKGTVLAVADLAEASGG